MSEASIYDHYIAGRASAALAVGVRLELFDLLDVEPLDRDTLARRLQVPLRPLVQLTRALQAMGLLVPSGDRWTLSGAASRELVRGKPDWLGGLIDLEVENFLSPELLLKAVRRDRSSVYRGSEPWQEHAREPERAAAFTRAMHSISSGPGRALAHSLDLSGGRALLDVAGGSGALSIALAREWPELRCVILELPAICELARGYIEEAGLTERISAREGDMFAPALPDGFDLILLSQVLHDWSPETGAALLGKARAALPPGGRVLIHEKLITQDGSGPLANALVDLDMLVWTQGQQYTSEELSTLLVGAGFGQISCRPTAGYWSLVEGTRV